MSAIRWHATEWLCCNIYTKAAKPQGTSSPSAVSQHFYKQLLVWSHISMAQSHFLLLVPDPKMSGTRIATEMKWEVAQNSSRNRQVPLEVENEQSKSQHGVSHHTLSKPRIADLLTLQLHLTEVNKQQVWKNCRWLKQLLWPPGAPSSSSLCCYWAQKHGRYWYQWIRWSR